MLGDYLQHLAKQLDCFVVIPMLCLADSFMILFQRFSDLLSPRLLQLDSGDTI